MLGLAARDREVVAQGPGDVLSRSIPGTSGGGGIVLAPGASRVIRRAPSRSSPSQAGSSCGRRLGADDDLAGRREILELEHARRRRPGDEQLAVRLGGEEEMARTRMDADRHAQLDRTDRALGLADLLDRPLHVGCGAGRALGVPLVGEEQEQGVAAELEHVAAVPLGDGDQIVEDRRDALHELLGAGLPVHREPLGECREARDVDRDERALDDARARRAGLLAPAAHEARQVGRESRGRGGGLGHPLSMAQTAAATTATGCGVSRGGRRFALGWGARDWGRGLRGFGVTSCGAPWRPRRGGVACDGPGAAGVRRHALDPRCGRHVRQRRLARHEFWQRPFFDVYGGASSVRMRHRPGGGPAEVRSLVHSRPARS